MYKSMSILPKHGTTVFSRDIFVRSKHSNEGIKLQVLGINSRKSGFHQSQVQEYPATKPLPLPSNIEDLASTEKLRFSPQRTRDISGSYISSSSSFNATPDFSFDERIECYDCTGAVSLCSAMQTNVPFPFTSNGKPTHLNMPGGQWGQNEKYMSDDLNNVHHINASQIYGGTCDLAFTNGNRQFFSKNMMLSSNLCPSFNMIQLRHMSTVKEKTAAAVVDSSYIKREKAAAEVPQLSRKEKLKAAVKDYGAVVIVFHVGISLISLGCCYLAIASGVDLTSIIEKWGVNEGAITAGVATQFVIAYAIHKTMAPGRVVVTLTAVPFIVKKLRKIGFLKPPKTSLK